MRAVAIVLVLAMIGIVTDVRPVAAQQYSDQSDPVLVNRITGDSELAALVVWTEDRGAGHRIFARRIHGNGMAEGNGADDEWELLPEGGYGPTGEQRWPSMWGDFIAWSEREPGGDWDVFLQQVDEHARPIRSPVLVSGGPGDQTHPTVGGFCNDLLVAWGDDRFDDGDIFGRWYGIRGMVEHTDEFWIVRSPGWAEQPALDPTFGAPKNKMVVYFADDRSGTRDIYMTAIPYTPKALPDPEVGHEVVVATDADEFDPAVAGPLGQRGLLAWSATDDTGDTNVWMQRYYDNQRPRGEPMLLAGGGGTQGTPTVISWGGDPRSYIYVGWADDRMGTLDVWGVKVRINGRPDNSLQVLAAD